MGTMRRNLKLVLGALVGILSCAGVRAIVPEFVPSRFQAIPERNVFGLKTAETPRLQTQPPALPKITLTGITTILGNKRVLMKETPAGAKPGTPNQEVSLILTEGQREGDVEVLNINERAGTVVVNNSGTVMTLDFDKDGAKLPKASPALPGPATGSNVPAPPIATANNTQPMPTPAVPSRRMHTLPSRNVRLRSSSSVPPPATDAPPSPTGLGTPDIVAQPPAPNILSLEQQQAELLQFQRDAARMDPNLLSVPNAAGPSPVPQAPAAPGLAFPPGMTLPSGGSQVLPQ